MFYAIFRVCATHKSMVKEANCTDIWAPSWPNPLMPYANNIDAEQSAYLHILVSIFEPPYDKTNKMTWAPSEDPDQPGHLPSLIRVFTVRMDKHWALNYLFEHTVKTLIRQGGCPGWSESSLGDHVILLVLLCGGSFVDGKMSQSYLFWLLWLSRPVWVSLACSGFCGWADRFESVLPVLASVAEQASLSHESVLPVLASVAEQAGLSQSSGFCGCAGRFESVLPVLASVA